MSVAASVQGLSKSFGGAVVLDGIDLDLPRGETTAIVGSSGCGKTTLLRLIAGFETPDAGSIDIDGTQVSGPGGFECPRAVQHDGKLYIFAMYFYGLQYTVGDDPFHFGPWRVVGPWHAPVIFNDDEDRWYITHAYRPFGKPSVTGRFREPHKGLYIGGLVWSDGVPVPVDLGDVLS